MALGAEDSFGKVLTHLEKSLAQKHKNLTPDPNTYMQQARLDSVPLSPAEGRISRAHWPIRPAIGKL